jgi:ubiquinone/menaquinone biosynthesis C-methylase UbiE
MSLAPSTFETRLPEAPPNFDRLVRLYRWIEWISFGPWLWRCRCEFLSQLGHFRHALVLGDGDGRFTGRLLVLNASVHVDAVDASSAMLGELLRRARPHQGRVQIHLADIRAWEPPAADYDLVVSHFFLDCLTTREVESVATRLRPRLRPGAAWLLSEFDLPANPIGRLIARTLVWFLYRVFGVLTSLRIRSLPDHRNALAESGFILRRHQTWLFGLLVSEWWEPRPTDRIPSS